MQDKDDKLDMSTLDIVSENIEKIGALFPNCVTESSDGLAINFDMLKQELSDEIVEGRKERYRLEWAGKKEAIVKANLPTSRTLRPVRKDSVDFDNTENIYIEGDNLEVLKILQESYLGKIKMIYIDPPYNTGKDFVYKDNFSKPLEELHKDEGIRNEIKERLVANPESSGRYHSDWLTLMYPRLKLARNLMANDGVIFISIDDNEVHNLKKICDEIFGETNFTGKFIWKKKQGGGNDSNVLVIEHEYILSYAKSINGFSLNLDTNYKLADSLYPFSDDKGEYGLVTLDKSSIRFSDSLVFEIVDPEGNKYLPRVIKGKQSCWRWGKKKVKNDFEDLVFKNGKVYTKYYRPIGITPKSLLVDSIYGRTETGNDDIKKIFDNSNPFSYPKPVALIKHLLMIGSSSNDIILDFFSGSATTAQATLQINAENLESRKYIVVQLPEFTDPSSMAFKEGYKTICDIGKDRIRRASESIKNETGAEIDYGFRVYRLDDSNMKDVYYSPSEFDQSKMDIFADNVKEDRTGEDLLTQIILDWGLPLSLPIASEDIDGKTVWKVAGNSLFACFDIGIDEAFAKQIAKEKPLRIVFKDRSFKDDTAKENVKQLLKQLSPETEMKVI